MLERLFGLKAAGVTPRGEILAGTTAFFTMAYVLFINSQIVSAAGKDRDAVIMATAVSAAFRSLSQ